MSKKINYALDPRDIIKTLLGTYQKADIDDVEDHLKEILKQIENNDAIEIYSQYEFEIDGEIEND